MPQDITAFNAYYIDQEENYIIRLQSLEEAAENAPSEQQSVLHNGLADLHGEGCCCGHVASQSLVLGMLSEPGSSSARMCQVVPHMLRDVFVTHLVSMLASMHASVHA